MPKPKPSIDPAEMIRGAVREELVRRKLTTYAAAGLLADIISRTHLYDWLRGDRRLGDDKASAILDRLGLTVAARPA